MITTICVGPERRTYRRQHTVTWRDSHSAGTISSWYNRNWGCGNWELENIFYATLIKYWCQVTCTLYAVLSDEKRTVMHVIFPHHILSDIKNNKQKKDISVNMFCGFLRKPYPRNDMVT